MYNTIEELESLVGELLKALRLRQNIDRATLATRAGCSVSVLKSLEYGTGSTLRTLIAVVRTLEREDWLRHVAPVPTISPLSLLRTRRTRQRASRSAK